MIAFSDFANHLWQSTAFAGFAALLAVALRRHHARTRCWLWTAASLKFLMPCSLLIAIGARLEWQTAPLAVREVMSSAMYDVGAPFDAPPVAKTAVAATPFPWTSVLAAIWAIGCCAVLLRWAIRWRAVARVVRTATPLAGGPAVEALDRARAVSAVCRAIPLVSTATALEPGVFGILRPVLVIPEGISGRLSGAQLQAIFAHELAHLRHRDNLAALLHTIVEAVFWFHPLVWWMGARMVDERERACDEDVLRLGGESRIYAESILKACEFYLQSPVACVSGVTGGELKARIERIMRRQLSPKLGPGGKWLLGSAAFAALAVPVFIGVANSPVARAQTAAAEMFDTASVKPAPAGQRGSGFITGDPGRFHAVNVTLAECIATAYGIQSFQLVAKNLPQDRYEILASAPTHPGKVLDARYEAMLQALLADRFQLKIHRDSKVMPVYALEVAKGGPKLKESSAWGLSTRSTPGHVKASGAAMSDLAMYLTRRIAHPVVDVTGLKGLYDFDLDWAPGVGDANVEPPDPDKPQPTEPSSGPSLFVAMERQLGLKLQGKKLAVEMVVVDHAEKPSAN
jgi:uncharacterized protein (TIGR03435 family)